MWTTMTSSRHLPHGTTPLPWGVPLPEGRALSTARHRPVSVRVEGCPSHVRWWRRSNRSSDPDARPDRPYRVSCSARRRARPMLNRGPHSQRQSGDVSRETLPTPHLLPGPSSSLSTYAGCSVSGGTDHADHNRNGSPTPKHRNRQRLRSAALVPPPTAPSAHRSAIGPMHRTAARSASVSTAHRRFGVRALFVAGPSRAPPDPAWIYAVPSASRIRPPCRSAGVSHENTTARIDGASQVPRPTMQHGALNVGSAAT